MHAQFQPSSEFGLIGNLQYIEQQRLAHNGRTGQSTHLLDSHESKSGLSSQLVTEECIQRGEFQHWRHQSELIVDPNLQHVHESAASRIEIWLKIRSD